MIGVSWSRYGIDDCIRFVGLTNEDVRVYPGAIVVGEFPSMAGRLISVGDDTCFVPRFSFVDGTTYIVVVQGVTVATLLRPRVDRLATTEVLGIYPTAAQVPRNLLRFYIVFSAPMSEGYAAEHVRLVDDDGELVVGALLPTDHELWDADRRRLTVLLDPARIKRGLVAHRQMGYPLQCGTAFRLVVDDGFRDRLGSSLQATTERRYEVGNDQRRRVEPDDWTLTVPSSHTVEPLDLVFDRPLDHGLLARCLGVVGSDGRRVDGIAVVGPEERSWRLVPHEAWEPGLHQLIVDPVLEDLAGNSVSRVFDRDMTNPEDDPREPQPVELSFCPR